MLANTFQGLGMNQSMITQFIPLVLGYVEQQGGAGTMGLLKNSIGY
jgi:hypothetical protein